MRSGVHRASFTFSSAEYWWDKPVMLGIVRPMNYERIDRCGNQYSYPTVEQVIQKFPSPWRDEVNSNAFLLCQYGQAYLCKGLEERYIRRKDELCFDLNDRIGLVLNLDAGTLSMHKNGTYVGELCSGLEGEYLWVCCLFVRCNGGDIRIADWE